MEVTDSAPFRHGAATPLTDHSRRRDLFAAQVVALEQQANRISLARLVLFFCGATASAAGFAERNPTWWGVAGALFVGFGVAVYAHAKVLTRVDGAKVRREIHVRHIARISGGWQQLPNTGAGLLPTTHAYAWDIDLLGAGSLFQRIDVTHSERGERVLVDWLAGPGSIDDVHARQLAVAELADAVEFRQELEASALLATDGGKLDPGRFHELAQRPLLFDQARWLQPVMFVLPAITLTLYVLGELTAIHGKLWYLPVVAQLGLLRAYSTHIRKTLDLASARQGVVEAFEQMLTVVERAPFKAPLLQALQQKLAVGAIPPSQHVARLRRWTGFAELRRQFLLYIIVNPLTLWDLHVLAGLERWIRDVGRHTDAWFDALAELEALCSLATLAHAEPDATFPTITSGSEPLVLPALAHPLVPASSRVANDLTTAGPATAIVITGSNMAGKSTLLRAVGVNVALALAGGPVCAQHARVPRVRLRASMRADDSLQSGASYFHAELTKLRRVVDDAESDPPVFFLLDELLRGTNARARHLGARAVLLHLIARRGSGLVATHDAMLGRLEDEHPGRVQNFHFTDVMIGGEMTFDYVLHPGIVRTSNALRLLAMAGIDVPEAQQDDNTVELPTDPRARSEQHP